MRGVKPCSSGLLMRLSPGRRGGGTTGMYPCPLSPILWEQGQGGHLGSDVRGVYTCVDRYPSTCGQTGMDTPAYSCGHTPFLRCSFSWLSSPWAASWWMDRARGQREAESSPVPSPLRASVDSIPSCSSQPLPLLLPLPYYLGRPGDQRPTYSPGWPAGPKPHSPAAGW